MIFTERQDTLFIFSNAATGSDCNGDTGVYHITYTYSGQQLLLIPIKEEGDSRKNIFINSSPFDFIPSEGSAARDWLQLDIKKDSVAGIGLYKAYKLLKARKSKPVIVAIIDNGMDIEHEDIKNSIWTNKKETPVME